MTASRVNESSLPGELNEYLDIVGQQPSLGIYTQICLCYPVADPASQPAIVETLRAGLERVSASFPWIAGQVVNEGAGENSSGLFKIVPFERTPRLVVKDLTHDASAPTMEALRYAEFPMRMLDESVVTPRRTLPGAPGEGPSDPFPVFFVQATFVVGGVLLAFVGHHGTMDMTGQGVVIDLIDKACRGSEFTDEELSTGNLPRRHLLSLLDDTADLAEVAARQTQRPKDAQETAPPPAKCTWAYFSFSAASLSKLKALAMENVDPDIGYVSSDDALSAFLWQSVMRVRQYRVEPTRQVQFARAVNVRRYLSVPERYPGMVQNMTYHDMQLQELVAAPLGVVASDLRRAVDPKTSRLAHATRELATLMDRTADKRSISAMANTDATVDIALSSWVLVDSYKLDFGLGLGTPQCVRRPQFTPVESLFYLMPKSADNEIAAGLCLRDNELEMLRVDGMFAKYGRYIG